MSDKLRVLFKTKGGHKEGMGDITSSLALAEEFRNNGHEASFIINNNLNVINLVSQYDFEYHVAESMTELTNYIEDKMFDIAILNQMNTPEDKALLFKKHSKMMATIEDTGESAKLADLRFNVLYPIDDAVTDFKFIPLSPVFHVKHNAVKAIKQRVEVILVMQGGGDTYGFTPKIIKSLYGITADINISVVLGPNFSHDAELNEVLDKSPRKVTIIRGMDDLSDLMMEADLAISAGGNTLFELACLGVPAIVLCAELFEVGTADRLQKEGFGINLGFGEYVDEKDVYKAVSLLIHNTEMRVKMSGRGKSLIDGRGAKRVAESALIKSVCL